MDVFTTSNTKKITSNLNSEVENKYGKHLTKTVSSYYIPLSVDERLEFASLVDE